MAGILIRRALGIVALLIGIVLTGWIVYNLIWPTEEFKRSFRSFFQLIIPASCLIVGWKWLRYQGKGIEEVTPPDLRCPELDAAVQKARNAMPVFLREVEQDIDGAFIKFPLQTPRGITEHIWAYVHSFKEGYFNVSIMNDPADQSAETSGRRNVPLSEVEDWQIMQPDEKIRGGYSLIALFEYRERTGKPLSPKMLQQKAQLLDAG